VAAAAGMDVDMDELRPAGRVVEGQAGLLLGLPEGAGGEVLPRLEVAAGLDPDPESPVEEQQHPRGPGDDGRGRDVRRVGVLVEGSVQPRQGGVEGGERRSLAPVDRLGPAAAEQAGELGPAGIGGQRHGSPLLTHAGRPSIVTVVAGTTAQVPTGESTGESTGASTGASTGDSTGGSPGISAGLSTRMSTGGIPTRVLVLGMAHADGTIDAAELLAVAEACGQTPEQIRSCLRRLVTEGLFDREGAGRAARYLATPRGMSALGVSLERTRLAYGQDSAGRGWDGHWRLVAVAVPESRRSARDALRGRLRALGGAPIQGGLHVSPHDWHKEVVAVAERLGIADGLTLATTSELVVGGERDPRELARTLWPVDDLAARYTAFCEHYAPVEDFLLTMRANHEHLSDTDFLAGALGIAVEYQACFSEDPLLPPELLPRPWPGRQARDLVLRVRRLGLTMRTGPARPSLFATFDDAIEAIR